MPQILIFGDSIAYGAWDTEGGWAGRLRNFMDNHIATAPNYFWLIYNLGVSGDTTRDLLERFDRETEARFDESEDHIILISIGTNDTIFDNEKKENWVPIDEFKSNLKQLINQARKYSDKIVLLGDTPVDESKVNPIPWVPNNSYLNKYIEEYNEVIKQTAQEQNVLFIDLLPEFQKIEYKNLLQDGDHPNSDGHKMMFEIVKNFLIEKKLIPFSGVILT